MRPRVGALVLMLALGGACSRSIELFGDGIEADLDDGGGVDDPGPSNWGSFAASLPLRACPDGGLLVVNTTSDSLDGGVPGQLSFRAALWESLARPGPDTVMFDPVLFPAEQPAVINLSGLSVFPLSLTQVCIDARDRGVVFRWPGGLLCPGCIWPLREDSLQVGLTLLNLPYEQELAGGSQVSGCRFGTDGIDSFRPWEVDVSGGCKVGPGNVFSGVFPVRSRGTGVRIEGNWFGVDPLTGVQPQTTYAIDVETGFPEVVGNVFSVQEAAILLGPGAGVLAQGNHCGVDTRGRPLRSARSGLLDFAGGTPGPSVIGPGNVIRGNERALILGGSVRVTRNEISGNDAGLVLGNLAGAGAPPAPPFLSLDGGDLWVDCPAAGTVELFSDPGAQGETFLGDLECVPGMPTRFPLALPEGRNLTATLTVGASTSPFSEPLQVCTVPGCGSDRQDAGPMLSEPAGSHPGRYRIGCGSFPGTEASGGGFLALLVWLRARKVGRKLGRRAAPPGGRTGPPRSTDTATTEEPPRRNSPTAPTRRR